MVEGDLGDHCLCLSQIAITSRHKGSKWAWSVVMTMGRGPRFVISAQRQLNSLKQLTCHATMKDIRHGDPQTLCQSKITFSSCFPVTLFTLSVRDSRVLENSLIMASSLRTLIRKSTAWIQKKPKSFRRGEVPALRYQDLASKDAGESSRIIRQRVNAARAIQLKRFEQTKIHASTQMAQEKLNATAL